MGKVVDMTGYENGRIKVIGRAGKDKHGAVLWNYVCKCGKHGRTKASNLRKMQSCGCIRGEKGKKILQELRKEPYKIHGESDTRLYCIWRSMIYRTSNSNCKDYINYGERGITVCEEWKDFLTFKKWALDDGYSENLTIDRIDNDKGYYPHNCRWTDRKMQNNNKRNSAKLEYKGKEKTIAQWAEEYSIKPGTLRHRIMIGMSIQEALETPVTRNGKGYIPKRRKS